MDDEYLDSRSQVTKEGTNKGNGTDNPVSFADLKTAITGLASLGKEVRGRLGALSDYLAAFQEQYGAQIASFVRSVAELPDDVLLIQQALAERGWSVLGGMPWRSFGA